MQCVYYDDRLPNGFEEQFFFSSQMPYTIQVKRFQTEDIVPLHYAETIELLPCTVFSLFAGIGSKEMN